MCVEDSYITENKVAFCNSSPGWVRITVLSDNEFLMENQLGRGNTRCSDPILDREKVSSVITLKAYYLH